MQTPDDAIRSQLLTFSLRPVVEIEAIADEHAKAPHLRIGQRTLAADMVTLVHGAAAAEAAAEAADVLFASDPTGASAAAFETLAARSRHATARLGTRRHGSRCSSPPVWPNRTATRGAPWSRMPTR